MKRLDAATVIAVFLLTPGALGAQDTVPGRGLRAGLARPEIREQIRRGTRGLQLQDLEGHEVRPAHVRMAESDDDGPTVESTGAGRRQVTPAARARAQRAVTVRPGLRATPGPALQVQDFLTDLVASLQSDAVGYSIQLRQHGNTIATAVGGHARRPGDGNRYWSTPTRMHVASVSKLITAIAMVRLLDDNGIALETPIAGYLPRYWRIGPNADRITFRQLLTHQSGIDVPGSTTDYITMREEIAAGVRLADMNSGHYENVNFGLMRILIPIINGDVDRDLLEETHGEYREMVDAAWDGFTTLAYRSYVARNLFSPAGISTSIGFQHHAADAIAYANPPGDGWNSGNLQSVSGGAGWIMSTGEVLSVMGAFRRNGLGIPPPRAQAMMDALFGLNDSFETDAGRVYYKKGRWRNSGRMEISGAYFLPNDMELMVMVNSEIDGAELWPLINQAIRDNVR